MPIISITEKEEAVTKVLDVTENTVLIPMLYCRDFDKGDYTEDTPAPKLYTDLSTFKNDLYYKAAWIVDGNPGSEEEITAAIKHKDRSYIMAYELLLAGLNVIIKPLEFDHLHAGSYIMHKKDKKGKNETFICNDVSTKTVKCKNGEDEEAAKEKVKTTIIPSQEKAFRLVEECFNDAELLEDLEDKNLYNIKFVTAGGYPTIGHYNKDDAETIGIYVSLNALAKNRGDAIALFDLREYFADKNELLTELSGSITDLNDDFVYSATFFPWCKFNVTDEGKEHVELMPAAFAYLMSYANSVKSNANWFAAAGTNRGRIPNLVAPNFDVGEALMHILQVDDKAKPFTLKENKFKDYFVSTEHINIRVNPVYNAGTEGFRVWGNMVTKILSTTGTQRYYREFLNVRVLLCDIIKTIYQAALITMFEPDDDITWLTFKSRVNTSVLEKARTGRGIKWYDWHKDQPTDKAELVANLEMKPIAAIDTIKVNLTLTDEDAIVSEEE